MASLSERLTVSGSFRESRRKIASARERNLDDENYIAYSQLLPSTKYWNSNQIPSKVVFPVDSFSDDSRLSYDYYDKAYNNDEPSVLDLRNDESNIRTTPGRHRSRSAPLRRNLAVSRSTVSERSRDRNNCNKDDPSTANLTSQFSKDVDPWQNWLEEKRKLQLTEQEKKKQETEQKKLAEKEKEIETNRRLQLSKLKRQEWLAKKLKDEIEAKLKEEKLSARKEKEELKEKEIKREKNEERVKEWKEKKNLEIRMSKEKVKQNEEKERKMAEEKALKSQERYDQWVKEASTRPSRVSASLGYTGGRLIGFYDWSSYPSPSYYNPVPWQPIEVPKEEKKQRKGNKPKSARCEKKLLPSSQQSRIASSAETNRPVVTANKKKGKSKKEPETLSPPLMWREVIAREQ